MVSARLTSCSSTFNILLLQFIEEKMLSLASYRLLQGLYLYTLAFKSDYIVLFASSFRFSLDYPRQFNNQTIFIYFLFIWFDVYN